MSVYWRSYEQTQSGIKHLSFSLLTRCTALLQFVTSPNYSSIPKFVGAEFSDPKYWEPSAENTKRLHTAAASFHEIWKTGDASIADKILDKDVKDYNLMFGGEPKVGSEAFKSMINGVFKVTLSDVCICQQQWNISRNACCMTGLSYDHGSAAWAPSRPLYNKCPRCDSSLSPLTPYVLP